MSVVTDSKIAKMFSFAVSWLGLRAFHHWGLVFSSSPSWNDPYSFHLFSASQHNGPLVPSSLILSLFPSVSQPMVEVWMLLLREPESDYLPVFRLGLWIYSLSISWPWDHEYNSCDEENILKILNQCFFSSFSSINHVLPYHFTLMAPEKGEECTPLREGGNKVPCKKECLLPLLAVVDCRRKAGKSETETWPSVSLLAEVSEGGWGRHVRQVEEEWEAEKVPPQDRLPTPFPLNNEPGASTASWAGRGPEFCFLYLWLSCGMEGDGRSSAPCRGVPRVLAGQLAGALPLEERCVPVARAGLHRQGVEVRPQREARRDRFSRRYHQALSEPREDAPWGHQPQSPAVDATLEPCDLEDKEIPLSPKELEERMGQCGHGSMTSVSLHSEVTEALPAHTCRSTILERSQEAGGNLNVPELTV